MNGEFSLRYTFMAAYGTISGPDGWYYGEPFGPRPLPIGEHPLDWDRGHMLGFRRRVERTARVHVRVGDADRLGSALDPDRPVRGRSERAGRRPDLRP